VNESRDEGPAPLELDAGEMRELGYRAVDALVDRWVGLAEAPSWRGATRRELAGRWGEGEPPPEGARDAMDVMEEAVREILPLAGRIDHPRFFAFIPSAPTWPSVLADFLSAGFNVFQGTWLESAGPSHVELTVLEWFRAWLGMPEGAGGLLTSGGSAANFLAVGLAREAAGWPARPVVYHSDQAHSSLHRAARLAGIPPEGIRALPTGEDLRLHPDTVRAAVDEDRAAGRSPLLVAANGGATNTGRVDPLDDLGAACRELGVHFHVDAAYGGFAVLDPRGARALAGIGRADSVTLDPHKWLFQPYECGCLLARDTDALERAFRVSADYLQDTELGREHVNFADRGLQLTRAFRALKIWMSVRTFGTEAFRAAVGRGIDLALRAEARIRRAEGLELLSAASLGVVTYRFRPPDGETGSVSEAALEELNRTIQDRIVESGEAMISSTRLRGRYALRLCILGTRTRWGDVEAVLAAVEREGARLARRGAARG
jgi:aromatic-L-amino-acid/L-tryptophan decarboxylase